jgi:hypothetical protein
MLGNLGTVSLNKHYTGKSIHLRHKRKLGLRDGGSGLLLRVAEPLHNPRGNPGLFSD